MMIAQVACTLYRIPTKAAYFREELPDRLGGHKLQPITRRSFSYPSKSPLDDSSQRLERIYTRIAHTQPVDCGHNRSAAEEARLRDMESRAPRYTSLELRQ